MSHKAANAVGFPEFRNEHVDLMLKRLKKQIQRDGFLRRYKQSCELNITSERRRRKNMTARVRQSEKPAAQSR